MKFADLSNFLQEEKGHHTTNIYMPSIGRDIPFKPITTADVKTLSRIGVFSDFDINNELLKLALFDKLAIEKKETCGLDSENILPIDFLSFLIGIRKLLNNELSYSFECRECNKKFEHTVDLESLFEKYIFGFKKKSLTFEKIDKHDNIWKFELEDFTMKEYLYYRYYIDRLSAIDSNNPDVVNEAVYSRPILYVKGLSKNDDKITDWDEHLLSDKITMMNMLPNELIINTNPLNMTSDNMSLGDFISANFDEEKLFKDLNKIKVTCPHCGYEYTGVFKFEDFFMF